MSHLKLKSINSQRGDTLIEVTMALSILAIVLLSSVLVTTRAFRLGQTARERTTLSEAASAQMEALRSFRDNHTWAEFLNGGAGYNGVINGAGGGPIACKATGVCMHLSPHDFSPTERQYIPETGAMDGPVPTSYIETSVVPVGGSPTNSVQVTITYGFEELGGSLDNVGHIKTTLTNLDFKP